MQEQLIEFETAVLAKEKGFDNELNMFNEVFDLGDNQPMSNVHRDTLISGKNLWILRPTQSLLQRWIREKHEINIFIYCYGFGYYPIHDNIPKPTGNIEYVDRRWNTQNKLNLGFKTYEEALEKGLQEALKLIK